MMINVKVKKQTKKQKLLISMSVIHCLVWIAKAANLANQGWEPSSCSKVIWGWYTEWMDQSNVHLMATYKAYEQFKKNHILQTLYTIINTLTKQYNRKKKYQIRKLNLHTAHINSVYKITNPVKSKSVQVTCTTTLHIFCLWTRPYF